MADAADSFARQRGDCAQEGGRQRRGLPGRPVRRTGANGGDNAGQRRECLAMKDGGGAILGRENRLRSSAAVKSSPLGGESRPFPAPRRENVAREEGRRRWRGELAGAAGREESLSLKVESCPLSPAAALAPGDATQGGRSAEPLRARKEIVPTRTAAEGGRESCPRSNATPRPSQ